MMICEICKIEFKSIKSLGIHVSKIHKNSKDYYLKYISKNDNSGCKTCNEETKFKGFSNGFSKFCSRKCMNSNLEIIEKKKQTSIKNWGYSNPSKSPIIKSKTKENNLKNTGYSNPMHLDVNIQKIKKTWKEKSISEIESIISKREKSCISIYGISNVSKLNSVKKQKEKTCFKNYQTKYPSQSTIIKEKIQNTSIKNWGYSNPSKSPIIKSKTKENNLKKYGKEYIFQIDSIKEKIKQSHIKTRNVDNPMKCENIKKILNDTFIKNWGYHPMKHSIIKKKIMDTCIERYGESNIFKIKEIKEIILKISRDMFLKSFLKLQKCLNIFLKDSEYVNSKYLHHWICGKCSHEFETCWNNIQQFYKCPKCYPRNENISMLEMEIYEYVKNIIPNIEILQSDRDMIPPKELDIYIPSKNIAIEFNGLYWHSEGMVEDNYHLNKTELCEKHGIQLIHIFEDEWIFKKDIVKSKLKNILNVKSENNIYANDCIIKEIDLKTKNDFLKENHIQGETESNVNLGSFYRGELISLMTFSKENDIWELNRFCNKLNYQISGMALKFLSHFKNNYQWKEIFSYVDRRWSQGSLYEKLGFNFLDVGEPNYWYIKNGRRIHQFDLKEREKEGYGMIFDCGNKKFSIIP